MSHRKKPPIIKRLLYTYDEDDPGGRKLSLGVYLLRVFLVLMAVEAGLYFFAIVHYLPAPLTAAEVAAKVPPRESPFPHKNLIEFLSMLNNLYLFGAGGIYGMFTGGNVWAKRYTNQPGSFESGYSAGGGGMDQQPPSGDVNVTVVAQKPPNGATGAQGPRGVQGVPGAAAGQPQVGVPTRPPVKIAGAQKATTQAEDP